MILIVNFVRPDRPDLRVFFNVVKEGDIGQSGRGMSSLGDIYFIPFRLQINSQRQRKFPLSPVVIRRFTPGHDSPDQGRR